MIQKRTQQQTAFDGIQTSWSRSSTDESVQVFQTLAFDGIVPRPIERQVVVRGKQVQLRTRVARVLRPVFNQGVERIRVPQFRYR